MPANYQTQKSPEPTLQQSYKIIRFITKQWLIYGTLAGIICSVLALLLLRLFFNLRMDSDPKEILIGWITWTFVGGTIGTIFGFICGLIEGLIVDAASGKFQSTASIKQLKRRVLFWNLFLPNIGLLFGLVLEVINWRGNLIFLLILYLPFLVVGLLVSRKFLRWWLEDTATPNSITQLKDTTT